ncbi:TetR/AcrR family transcriptional regulator [Rhodococcus sp. HNM0569]|nr:TetR/AcrR family transcriptional regulator [Rhodococcus sp. HNM0569]NLU83973.1 TetR/AcrR family transcriptional regulator [Rhodococcus sp. HNM0569]
MPKFVRIAWGLEQPGTRGPRRGVSLQRIVEAAIEVGDAEGASALSMARVAKQLGMTTMSLYRYVDSKDDLLELISDAVVGPGPDLDAQPGWRAGLREWARLELECIARHEWWLDLPIRSAPLGPNNLSWLEAGLRVLAPTGLAEQAKTDMVVGLTLFVLARARLARDVRTATDEYAAVLPRILDPERFPHLLAAVEAGVWSGSDADTDGALGDADLLFGLDRLLDGYEVFVSSYTAARERAGTDEG